MITLNKIRELVLSQEQELEKLIFEYFLQKDITNYHNSSFNKNDKKNEIKLSIEDMISQGNLEKAKELLYKYKEISGKDASYYSIAGIISLNENNIEDAFEKFTKGLNIDNTNSDLLYNIAYLNLVVGNTDEALEYYKRCINNTDDKDLIIEVTDIIDKLQDKISHTLITFGLTKEESMNFKGENRVIALIENDNLEHENNYEENGIINYEVNSKKSKDILGYLVRRNKNCIIIFKDIDKIDYINNFKNKYIDKKVKQTLLDAGYKNNEHYSCYRYVDDVFFYYNDTKILERAMSAFEHLLHEYKLCISKEKSDDWERPFITPISVSKIKIDALLSDFIRMRKSHQDIEDVLEDEIAEDEEIDDVNDRKIEEALECKDFIYINSKEVNRAFKSLMVENDVKSKDIMNYTLAVISTKLESLLKKFDKNFYVLTKAVEQHKRKNECQKKIYQMEKMLHRYLDGMIDVIFFLYSDCKRVNTTLKMMNILNNMIIYLGSNYKEKDGRIIKRFSSALRDEISKKIQNEITIVFKTTSFDINAQIETLYFLITLKSMPRHYGIDSNSLNNYFSGRGNDRFDTSKLNALSIIILMYYYGNTKAFGNDKKYLIEGINNKYKSVNLPDKRKDAELIILALDLLACPYITHNDRKVMCKVLQIDEAKQTLIERYFRRHKFMFTKWTNVDLTKELGAKVSQEVYT